MQMGWHPPHAFISATLAGDPSSRQLWGHRAQAWAPEEKDAGTCRPPGPFLRPQHVPDHKQAGGV